MIYTQPRLYWNYKTYEKRELEAWQMNWKPFFTQRIQWNLLRRVSRNRQEVPRTTTGLLGPT
uniref:Uncharacterized protein n=1 Tax=Fusarium oxysporum (strain Fo5176) TaxID=660025 RepID=A0A0D2YJ28_FUSOF